MNHSIVTPPTMNDSNPPDPIYALDKPSHSLPNVPNPEAEKE
jgi:hypothetical protein